MKQTTPGTLVPITPETTTRIRSPQKLNFYTTQTTAFISQNALYHVLSNSILQQQIIPEKLQKKLPKLHNDIIETNEKMCNGVVHLVTKNNHQIQTLLKDPILCIICMKAIAK